MMDSRNLILITFLIFWCLYAVVKEYGEHDDSFRIQKPREGESIYRSMKKLEKCASYELHTIKWRRTLICTVVVIVLIFALIHQRVPGPKELLLHVFLIFLIFFLSWNNYTGRTSSKAADYISEHLHNIRQRIETDHAFILPSSFG